MNRWPTRFDVVTAERRLASAKRETGERIAQVRLAVRLRLTKPSTLILVTGLGALFGAWFTRRIETQAEKGPVAVRTPMAGLVYSMLIRFGWQYLAEAWTSHRHSDAPTSTQAAKP